MRNQIEPRWLRRLIMCSVLPMIMACMAVEAMWVGVIEGWRHWRGDWVYLWGQTVRAWAKP